MKSILVTGASGFIAREIIAKLIEENYEVIACARNTEFVKEIFPNIKVIPCDFINDTNSSTWKSRLSGIDAVINCVGVFQTRKTKDTWLVHYDTPKALFDACVGCGIEKIIHISALGIDKAKLPYCESKLAADNYLETLTIDSTIIRPSLVYGQGSYGGSSLFRGFSGLPFVLPLPGSGKQRFQPVHINDLASIVVKSLKITGKQTLSAVGKTQVTLKHVLNGLRRWLGFKKARNITVPFWLIQCGAKIGDWIGRSAINTTGINLLQYDNIAQDGDYQRLQQTLSFSPCGFDEGLMKQPSQIQDRWHARLYFIKPLLRSSIAILWIWTAIVSLFLFPHELSYQILSAFGLSAKAKSMALITGGIIDAVLGILCLLNIKIRWVGTIQIVLITIYSLLISVFLPDFWLDPFGPIAKNIPLIFATLTMIALEPNR